jgi:hypothetical protein
MASRTVTTSEDRDSDIRQRCGCKICSSCTEGCSAPSSRRHVEDVHSVGVAAICARRETCTRNQQTNSCPLNHPIPQPAQKQHAKIRQKNMATRTVTTSEDRDSDIRQRCGCKRISSYAESCSAPSSRRHIEDVHSVGGATRCARHQTCTSNQQSNPRPLKHLNPKPKQQDTKRKDTAKKHGNTYNCSHQRRSRLRHSAAMWLQENIELR